MQTFSARQGMRLSAAIRQQNVAAKHSRVQKDRQVVSKRSLSIAMSGFYSLAAKDVDGSDVSFDQFEGKVVLVTNVASACGFTHTNYTQLTELYNKYKDQGLEILAFPCNQFGRQESGSNPQIKQFAQEKYSAGFKVMDKVDVNGPQTSPVWQHLKSSGCPGCDADVRWNFAAKFLIDKEGKVVLRSGGSPNEIEAQIKQLLAA